MSREAFQAFSLAAEIFRQYRIAEVVSVEKIDIGFSNDLYCVNEAYILKLGRSEEDDKSLEKEIYFCRLFQGRLPVPKIVASDASKTRLGCAFVVYEKIEGDNLYAKWHLYTDGQRKEIVRRLCACLRAINATPHEEAMNRFESEREPNWHDGICHSILEALDLLRSRNHLSPELDQTTRNFLDHHHSVLHEQCLALTYFDPHFDNILVREGQIVGLLDFERTGWMSLDYVLDLVRRMVEYPSKYVSARYRPFIRDEDYALLLEWYREFYPEVFAFPDLDTRLALYSIEHTLRTMLYFPEDKELPRLLAHYLRADGVEA